jgi:hypothetical protein
MLQPRDTAARAKLFAAFKTRCDKRFFRKMHRLWRLYNEELKQKVATVALLEPDNLSLDEIASRSSHGQHAGRILNWILEQGPEASLNRAFGEFAEPRLQRRTQSNLWREMMPAVHLWAARHRRPIPGVELAGWLVEAEEIRRQGEAFVPRHGRDPLLDPTQTWRLP